MYFSLLLSQSQPLEQREHHRTTTSLAWRTGLTYGQFHGTAHYSMWAHHYCHQWVQSYTDTALWWSVIQNTEDGGGVKQKYRWLSDGEIWEQKGTNEVFPRCNTKMIHKGTEQNKWQDSGLFQYFPSVLTSMYFYEHNYSIFSSN